MTVKTYVENDIVPKNGWYEQTGPRGGQLKVSQRKALKKGDKFPKLANLTPRMFGRKVSKTVWSYVPGSKHPDDVKNTVLQAYIAHHTTIDPITFEQSVRYHTVMAYTHEDALAFYESYCDDFSYSSLEVEDDLAADKIIEGTIF